MFGMEIVIYIYGKKIAERLYDSYRVGKNREVEFSDCRSRFNFLK